MVAAQKLDEAAEVLVALGRPQVILAFDDMLVESTTPTNSTIQRLLTCRAQFRGTVCCMNSESSSRSTDSGSESTRRYQMRARQEAIDETRERILEARAELWLTRHYDEVTLANVADLAGVSRQTVYRQFGTKDELLIATAEWKGPQGEAQTLVEPGDVDGAISRLMTLYETMGDANVRALGLEGRVDAMDHMLKRGRSAHRAWIEHVFGPWLPAHGSPDREPQVMTLYAATDVMQWKLLRRDFHFPAAETEKIRGLVRGVICTIAHSKEEGS